MAATDDAAPRLSGEVGRAAPSDRQAGPVHRPQMSDARVAAREADPDLGASFERYVGELGLPQEQADLLTGARVVRDFFEAALETLNEPGTVAAWMTTDVRGALDGRSIDELPFSGRDLGALLTLVQDGTVSRRAAKDVLARMAESGGDPADLVEEMGLVAVTDAAELGAVIDEVLAAWPSKVAEFKAGKHNLVGLFVGEVMKATRGAADPKAAKDLILERLSS